jgi:hypothetical protein
VADRKTYLCFFDDDAYFDGEPAGFASELSRLDEDGGIQFGRSELHLDTLATPRAIVREHVRPVERAVVDMLALMFSGELDELGIEVAEADRASVVTLQLIFRQYWDRILNPTDRYQVYKQYQQLTGGRDIRIEWDLPSHGLTFTIDRMESGGDPRF